MVSQLQDKTKRKEHTTPAWRQYLFAVHVRRLGARAVGVGANLGHVGPLRIHLHVDNVEVALAQVELAVGARTQALLYGGDRRRNLAGGRVARLELVAPLLVRLLQHGHAGINDWQRWRRCIDVDTAPALDETFRVGARKSKRHLLLPQQFGVHQEAVDLRLDCLRALKHRLEMSLRLCAQTRRRARRTDI